MDQAVGESMCQRHVGSLPEISGDYLSVTEEHGWVQLSEDPKVLEDTPHLYTSSSCHS